jgi:hypothetical protein
MAGCVEKEFYDEPASVVVFIMICQNDLILMNVSKRNRLGFDDSTKTVREGNALVTYQKSISNKLLESRFEYSLWLGPLPNSGRSTPKVLLA